MSQDDSILILDKYRRGLSPGASATKPKYVMEVDNDILYFKFGLGAGEICAELLSYNIAKKLGIPVATTRLAEYKGTPGIASYDIGEYEEIDDSGLYSIIKFIHIPGFIETCLFDYLIMNEDRHARNWGVQGNAVAPLFDHNITFGADTAVKDETYFMENLTSAFTIETDYDNNMDGILSHLCSSNKEAVRKFLSKLDSLESFTVSAGDYAKLDPSIIQEKCKLLKHRIDYMKRKAGEYFE